MKRKSTLHSNIKGYFQKEDKCWQEYKEETLCTDRENETYYSHYGKQRHLMSQKSLWHASKGNKMSMSNRYHGPQLLQYHLQQPRHRMETTQVYTSWWSDKEKLDIHCFSEDGQSHNQKIEKQSIEYAFYSNSIKNIDIWHDEF